MTSTGTNHPMPEEALRLTPLPAGHESLGAVLHYLARREPFRGFRFGDMVATVDGQIQRGHCLLALRGRKIVGYLGWATYDAADAASFARTGVAPPLERARGQDVVWVLTAASNETSALRAMLQAGRARYVGKRAMGVRYRADGTRIIFDQPIRRR
jgi:hemolysin-activating ACP:hemolysin acyltransferase